MCDNNKVGRGGNKMKRKMLLLVGIMVLVLGLVGAPASWADFFSQGVTFSASLSGGDLVINMTGTGDGNWTGINDLSAFQIDDFGTASGTFTVVSSNGSFTLDGAGLNAGLGGAGCEGMDSKYLRTFSSVALVSTSPTMLSTALFGA